MISCNLGKHIKKLFFVFLISFSLSCFAGIACIGDNYAMVIIDMQSNFITRSGFETTNENKIKVKELIKNQIEAINIAKQNKIPIIFIEYKNFGETITELKKAVNNYTNVTYFIKNTDGMFNWDNDSLNEINKHFISKQIGNLLVLGANGGACVEDSIRGSLSNKCNILTFSKAIADFNYSEFIYPYKYEKRISSTCPSCKFRQTDDIGVIAVELASKQTKMKPFDFKKINDTNRELSEKKGVIEKTKDSNKKNGLKTYSK